MESEENNVEEIWKDVVGYEGKYQCSSIGRVRNEKMKLLTPANRGNGYFYVTLYKDGVFKKFFVHRLVASTFLPDYDESLCVDHINTMRTDNRVENIRMVTHKQNSNNILTRQHISESKKSEANPMFNKHLSTEHRRKQSEAMKRYYENKKNGLL